jgi:signal transduction histidine kinase
MSIRIKLAVILALAIGTTTIIAASIFISQQRHSLQISEEEKVSLLMENVKTMARESVLARDPLMLIDYLRFLSRDRREVLDARASVNGVWQGHSPPAEKPDPNARIERVTILNDSGTQKIVVEVVLSRAVLESRLKHVQQAMATNLIRAALGVVLGGIVLSFPLGWTLTSRLVEIEKVMKEVGEGHLDKEVFDSGSDEVARLARGLNAMTAHLRELAEMKRTFIASVTHELRSPLFAIESYVKQLLRESTRLNDEDRNRLERVQANASRLAAFVTSLLDMAKIERGQLEYKPKQTDVVKLVEDVVEFQS